MPGGRQLAWLGLLTGALLLAACGGGGKSATTASAAGQPTLAAPTTASGSAGQAAAAAMCSGSGTSGDVTVGDLAGFDAAWPAQRAAADKDAKAWQADATLIRVYVECNSAANHLRWVHEYVSPSAGKSREFYSDYPAADTQGLHGPTPLDPTSVSFTKLHQALLAAGHTDSDPLLSLEINSREPSQGQRPGAEWTANFDDAQLTTPRIDATTGAVATPTR